MADLVLRAEVCKQTHTHGLLPFFLTMSSPSFEDDVQNVHLRVLVQVERDLCLQHQQGVSIHYKQYVPCLKGDIGYGFWLVLVDIISQITMCRI